MTRSPLAASPAELDRLRAPARRRLRLSLFRSGMRRHSNQTPHDDHQRGHPMAHSGTIPRKDMARSGMSAAGRMASLGTFAGVAHRHDRHRFVSKRLPGHCLAGVGPPANLALIHAGTSPGPCSVPRWSLAGRYAVHLAISTTCAGNGFSRTPRENFGRVHCRLNNARRRRVKGVQFSAGEALHVQPRCHRLSTGVLHGHRAVLRQLHAGGRRAAPSVSRPSPTRTIVGHVTVGVSWGSLMYARREHRRVRHAGRGRRAGNDCQRRPSPRFDSIEAVPMVLIRPGTTTLASRDM